ncbi:hypothetical protein RCH16_002967 [Cryobacterium sp. MP_M5]|uniref:DUF4389 domain-containing protein n=1 Tax=unclassified Cryobacterium TaxID=2649013 RepID=UPI0018CB8616|nr:MULTISPECIES: DUF4389 domain-containing protein [unclassified Cryobacterium]MBG6059495.1 hypothetical protein [Cryobacterium sp. MP_M3]MEC5177941.1 hypothetical protein [Cryobacterium sp. MP_M5]
MKPAYVVMLVLGTVFSLLGLGMLTGGVAATVASSQQADNGFFSAPPASFSADSYALTSPRLDVAGTSGIPAGVASIRLEATSTGGDVFIGIAPQAEVDRYLTAVHHTELVDVSVSPFRAEYRDVPGTARPALPGDQGWWSVSATGPGTQQVVWDVQPGTWAVVVMNADASPRVAVQLRAGVRLGLLGPLAIGLVIAGILLLLLGIALVVLGAIGLGRGTPVPPGGAPAGIAPPGPMQPGPMSAAVPPIDEWRPYPARLTGEPDPVLSRWLWLVKWFLVIPHLIVLFFLWCAFFVTTIVAGFAILFTGRYPASLFTFNVGVLRWNWRVAFYSYSALGTDRYPPFTLATTDYPADLQVDYPARLSNGLVLVKWWLLALPHLLIVAVITGSTWSWRTQPADWPAGAGTAAVTAPSLIGLLVLLSGLILLFTGRLRRTLFDLILGLNRWVIRVMVYTSLMRDDYPPFRLDQGSADPPAPVARP